MIEPQESDISSVPESRVLQSLVDKLLLLGVSATLALLLFVWIVVQPEFFPLRDGIPFPEAGDSERLKAHVKMLSETFSYRDFLQRQNLEKSAQYIRENFEKAGFRVRFQEFEVEGNHFKNVIADYGPSPKIGSL